METKHDLIDGWQLTHENERQFTHTQNDSLGRIDRIYTTQSLFKNCIEWSIENNCGILDYQITITVVPWTSSHILYSLPLHQKGDVSKATC